jgi:hypothetical protein
MRVFCSFLFCVKAALFAAQTPELSTARQVRDHWAFKEISNPLPPKAKNEAWSQNPVDRFVLLKLEGRGWTPSARADKRTLIRRAYQDLIGLMPTFVEVQRFVADQSPNAWPNLISRLLASPHYGERWGRHWLDVARYADNKGYVGVGVDRRYPYSFTYRDYVVRSFNEDLPFNQFIIEQLAADHLELGNDKRPLAALGFLTLGRRFLNREDDIIDDRIDVVTRGFMGLSVSCARCHDHKYDPVPTADYYSLHGIFASSKEPAVLPLIGQAAQPMEHATFIKEKELKEREISKLIRETYSRESAKLRRRGGEYMLAAHECESGKLSREESVQLAAKRGLSLIALINWKKAMTRWRAKSHPVFLVWFGLKGDGNPLVTRASTPKEQSEVYSKLFIEAENRWNMLRKKNPNAKVLADANWEAIRQVVMGADTPATVPKTLAESDRNSLLFGIRNRLKNMRSKIGKLESTHPGAPPRAHVLEDKAKLVEPHIYLRGNRYNRGARVPRQFLEHFSANRKPFKKGSGRLELARAIANRGNPLTARVLVNRVWAHHFGHGLVTTPSDFGLRAKPPTHPQLLDWLAAQFMAYGWSIKKLHRQIMLSSTYQQVANDRLEYVKEDPGNTHLWKMNRQRLAFEALRDGILQASGHLDLQLGGRPVDIAEHPTTPRRTLYGFVDRQNLPSLFRIFDFASPDAHCPHRYENTVPQQALYLMNSPFITEQSKRLVSNKGFTKILTDKIRVAYLYHTVFQRDPTAVEIREGVAYVAAAPGDQRVNAWVEFAQVLLLSSEFRFVD